uniref:Uncharacterized protein n=1 Tax=Arundo donax TaxID=35708 RepID=A0A0A9H5U0_ARUDO
MFCRYARSLQQLLVSKGIAVLFTSSSSQDIDSTYNSPCYVLHS